MEEHSETKSTLTILDFIQKQSSGYLNEPVRRFRIGHVQNALAVVEILVASGCGQSRMGQKSGGVSEVLYGKEVEIVEILRC